MKSLEHGLNTLGEFFIDARNLASDWLSEPEFGLVESIRLKTLESYAGFYEMMNGVSNMDYPVWKKKMDPEVYIFYSTAR